MNKNSNGYDIDDCYQFNKFKIRTLQILYVQYKSQRNKILYFFCLKQIEIYTLRQQNKCVNLKPGKKIEIRF